MKFGKKLLGIVCGLALLCGCTKHIGFEYKETRRYFDYAHTNKRNETKNKLSIENVILNKNTIEVNVTKRKFTETCADKVKIEKIESDEYELFGELNGEKFLIRLGNSFLAGLSGAAFGSFVGYCSNMPDSYYEFPEEEEKAKEKAQRKGRQGAYIGFPLSALICFLCLKTSSYDKKTEKTGNTRITSGKTLHERVELIDVRWEDAILPAENISVRFSADQHLVFDNPLTTTDKDGKAKTSFKISTEEADRDMNLLYHRYFSEVKKEYSNEMFEIFKKYTQESKIPFCIEIFDKYEEKTQKSFNVPAYILDKQNLEDILKEIADKKINPKIKNVKIIAKDSATKKPLNKTMVSISYRGLSEFDLAREFFTGKLAEDALDYVNFYKTGACRTNDSGEANFSFYLPCSAYVNVVNASHKFYREKLDFGENETTKEVFLEKE